VFVYIPLREYNCKLVKLLPIFTFRRPVYFNLVFHRENLFFFWLMSVGQQNGKNNNWYFLISFKVLREFMTLSLNALSREFRCRWRHLSCKLRPEIDNRFTFTLIKSTMRFKQIRKDIYRFWCQNGAILLLSFWLNNESQIFPEKHSQRARLRSHITHKFPLKIWKLSKELINFKMKTMPFPLPNGVVNIGQGAQWNVNKLDEWNIAINTSEILSGGSNWYSSCCIIV
jgi:hypothetical protein